MVSESESAGYNNLPGSSSVHVEYSAVDSTQSYVGGITSVAVGSDGHIGYLSIPRLGIDVNVYENTDLDTMKRGVGHFSFTSQWDGNVGLASHNRGSASYFRGIWNLESGDEIIYTTSAGTRTYRVESKQKVDENDLSDLAATSENVLSLITCVENQSSLRWLVRAVG
jgi:sortase A